MWVLHQNTWNLAWTAVNGTGISNHLSFWNIKFMFWVAFYGGKNRWASSLWQVVLLNLLEFNTNLSVQRWLWYDSISSLQIYHVAKKHWFGRFHKLMLYRYLPSYKSCSSEQTPSQNTARSNCHSLWKSKVSFLLAVGNAHTQSRFHASSYP